MNYLDITGLKRFLAQLLIKVVAAINEVATQVVDIQGDYLSKSSGGTVEGTLKTDDVQVGKWQNGSPVEDIDPDTRINRAAGSLRVNGTTELAGEIITHGQDVDFGNVNVSGKLDVGGSAKLSETFINGTLDMCGGDIENVQSITVSGTVRGNTYKAPKLDAAAVSGTRIGKENEPYQKGYIKEVHCYTDTDNEEDYGMWSDGNSLYLGDISGTDKKGNNNGYTHITNDCKMLHGLTVVDELDASGGIKGDLDGNAASADKLNTSAGSASKPVYFNGGKPVACTYELNATVPSGAKFTDTVYTHPNTSGNKHIPSGGKSGQILRWSADGTAVWGTDNNTTYTAATQSKDGLMSAADKKKVDNMAEFVDLTETQITSLLE